MRVTIKKGKITKIIILSHDKETPQYFHTAKAVVTRVMAGQTPNVSAVSGATYSSNGILEAIMNALKRAEGVSKHAEEDKKPSKKKEDSEPTKQEDTSEVADGNPANGVFSGSALCNPFGYTVHIKVKFKDGKAVAIYGLKITDNSDSNNKSYWEKAWKPIVKRILKKQGAEVDAVSGATYSSNAIMKAYANAYAKAVKADDADEEEKQDEKEDEDEIPKPQAKLKDGIYRVSTVVSPDEGEDFFEYVIEADAVVTSGMFVGFENILVEDTTNLMFCKQALEGTQEQLGILKQLVKKQDALAIDAVTGATCSSDAWISLFQELVKLASE